MQHNKNKFLLIAVMSLMLLWVASNSAIAALSESFTGTTFPPTGWTVYNFNAGNAWARYTTYYNTTPACARIQYDPHNNDWLITPQQSIGAYDKLTFYYRAHSTSYVETLFVRVSTSSNVSDTSAYSVVSTIMTSSTTWTKQEISLSAYAGQNIYIAFYYPCWDNYGFAIDDVNIITPPANDMATLSIGSPPNGSYWAGNSSVSVTATVKNQGTATQNQVPVNLQISDGVSYTYTDVESTGTLVMDQTQLITFIPNWTVPNAFATYTIKVWTALAGDANAANDTITITVNGIPQGYTWEGFEGTFPPQNWTIQSLGTYTAPWTKSSSAYHTGANSARGYYNSSGWTNEWMITPRLDLSAKSGGTLGLWRKFTAGSASYPDTLEILMSEDGGVTWPTRLAMSTPDSTSDASFVYRSYTLISSSDNVKIAFRYASKNGYASYIDDVVLPPLFLITKDMATLSIDSPPAGSNFSGNDTVGIRATVKNWGANTQSNVPVTLTITDGASYTYTDVETTGTLTQGQTQQITFVPNWTVPNQFDTYTIKVKTELVGDQNPSNDYLTISVSSMPEGYVLQGFEGTTFPPTRWASNGNWGRSTSYPHTGSAAAYAHEQNAWLFTPLLKVGTGDTLIFWYRAESATYPTSMMVRLSSSANQTDTSGYTTVLADYPNITSTTYQLAKLDLSPYKDKGNVYIAFYRYYGASNYWYLFLDDVYTPRSPIQIKITPDSVYAEGYVDSFFDVFLTVSNIGAGTLTYSSSLSTPAGYLTVIPTSGSLGAGASEIDTLRFNTTGLAGHYYDTLVVTSNSETKATNLIPIHLYVRMVPNISVSPDSFSVGVEANGTANDALYINNTGNGELNWAVETFESGKFGAVFNSEPPSQPHKMNTNLEELTNIPEKQRPDLGWGMTPTKGNGGPDAFGYKWKDSDAAGGPIFNWIEINSIGTQVLPSDDGNVGPYAIGFPFKFYGTTFDSFRIAANGFATFTSTSGTLTNDTIPSTAEPNNLLALMWDDLRPASGGGSGNIYYYSDGSKLVIEYDHVIRFGQTACPYTMEIILYPSGKIVYQYLQMGDGTCTYLNQSTIGIENGTGTDGLEVVYNANYVHDNLAIVFSAAPSWIVFAPESGVAPAFGADTVDVTFDATGILGGDFYGGFVVTSDDPDTPMDTVPVHMQVLAPTMTFSPDSIMTTATEGQSPFGVTLNVGNTGNGKLVFSITEGIPWLSVAPVSDTVMSGDPASTVTLTIDASSLYAGHYHGELKVYSNDPNFQPYTTYQVYLTVGPNPDIAVTPDSFYIGIYAGYTKDTTMTISNTGDGHLVWGLTLEELGRKGPDTTLYEGFEGTTFPPTDWTIVNNDGGSYNWARQTSYYHTGVACAYSHWESSTLRNDDWLITPRISIGSNDTISFWGRAYSTTWPESLEVRLSTTTNDVSAFTHLLWAGNFLTADWQQIKVELGKFSRGKVYIAFVNKGLDEFYLMVDDIAVLSYAGPWLTFSPNSGVTNPHSTDQVGLQFSSVGIENDMYANIWVTSNDPDESPIWVPVHMEILGPNYSVSPPETLVIDALEGQYTDGHVFMQNYGGHAPLAYKITDEVAWLSETPDTIEVPIDSSQDVTVTVDGNQLIAGDYATKLFIKTNDFSTPADTLVVIVHMGPAPDISVVPDSFQVTIPAGSTSDATLTVNNDGDGHLAVQLSTENTGLKTSGNQPGNTIDRSLAAPQEQDRSKAAPRTSHPASLAPAPHDSDMSKGDKDVLITEGFEAGVMPPSGWSTIINDPSYTWGIGTYSPHSGTYYADIVYDDLLNPQDEWFVTPALNLKEMGASGHVSFWWYMSYYWAVDPYNNYNIELWISTNGGSTWSERLWYEDTVGVFTNWTWYEASLDLSKFLDKSNVKLGWRYVGTDGAEGAIDDITIEAYAPPWLSVSPDADTIDPHSSANFNVHFDATDVLGGDMFGKVVIASNDPDENPMEVPVHMIVAGANYSVHPLEMDVDALENQITPDSLRVFNTGGLGNLSFKMTWTAPWLTAIPDTADIPPDGSQNVTVRIDGNQLIAGEYYTEIYVKTNAANQQYDTIPVYVHMGPNAEVDITPMSLRVPVPPNCNRVENIKVENKGLGHLRFATAVGDKSNPKFGAGVDTDKLSQIQKRLAESANLVDKSNPMHLSAVGHVTNNANAPLRSGPITKPGKDIIWDNGGSVSGGNLYSSQLDVVYPFVSQVAEDFLLDDNMNVTGVHWWGGFWNGDAPSSCDFYIYIYADDGTGNAPTGAGMADPSSTALATYFFGGLTGLPLDPNGFYEYDVTLTPSFVATGGVKYWIAIQGALTFPPQWGWTNTSGTLLHTAMYGFPLLGDPFWTDELDAMAFYLSGEPAAPPCPFTFSPASDTLDPESFAYVTLTFDPTAFEACADETLCCNLVFSTNDPDEQTVTVPVCAWFGRGDLYAPNCLIDIGDVVFLVNYILKGGPAPNPICTGDLAIPHDDMVDMSDLIYLIQYLFSSGTPPVVTPAVTPTPMQR